MRLVCLADMSHIKSAERWLNISCFCQKQVKVKYHISKDSKCKIKVSLLLAQEKDFNILCSLRCNYFCSLCTYNTLIYE